MAKYSIKEIADIRIIPMGKGDAPIEYIQSEFFEDRLPNKEKGWYHYYNQGLRDQEYDLLLFQYDNHIIASGILSSVEGPYPKAYVEEHGFKGDIVLKKGTIKTFRPIGFEDLKRHLDIDRLSQAKYCFKQNEINDLEKLIDKLEIPR
ncbi:MAG: hypothetical protein RR047_00370 [Bacilli bacterium]